MRRSTKRSLLAVPIATMLALLAVPSDAFAQKTQATASARTTPPSLIVFVTVDQMRPDYFTRFLPQLTGGLGLLYREGAVFTNAFQDHGITETAPGHSVTMSGRFPVHTGIAMNSAGVNDTTVQLVGTTGLAASPVRFRGTTLTDWIRAIDPRSRSLSVSRKDRGAILPIGKSKSAIFWYANNGTFTTSTYYSDTLPTWLQKYNAKRRAASFAGKTWNPLLEASAYPEPDSVPIENNGKDFMFPHTLSSDTAKALRDITSFPWMDQLTLEAALAGVRAMSLGGDHHTDILAVSLSTTDAIGHAYGPDSREQHDQILQLDRELGAFFDTLFRMRGHSHVVIALTADHAVAAYPEVHVRDPNAGAVHVDISQLVASYRASIEKKGGPERGLTFGDGVVSIDRAGLIAAHMNPDSIVAAFRDTVLKIHGVKRAETIGELQHEDTVKDVVARRWLHMFDTDSIAALVITLTPYSYWGAPGAAEHGAPYDYDAHVPVIFYGTPFKPGKYGQRTLVADMAPTLAQISGVRPLEKLDGHSLVVALR